MIKVKRQMIGILIAFLNLPSIAFEEEPKDILWIELTPFLAYAHPPKASNCDELRGDYLGIYLVGEVRGNRLEKAALAGRPFDPFPNLNPRIPLLPEEVREIEIFWDAENNPWLKRLTLTARLLEWIAPKVSGALMGGFPPIQTVESESLKYLFDTTLLGDIFDRSYAQCLPFSGKEKSGRSYNGHLNFVQRQLWSY